MKLKTISVEQLALETAKVVNEARKHPVVVRSKGKPALIIRRLVDDETADELLLESRGFRAAVRAGRRRRAAGAGVPLNEARRRLGV